MCPARDLVGRLWIDVETSLPVGSQIEFNTGRGLLTGFKKLHCEFKAYDLQWDAEIPEGIFDPAIPEDYTELRITDFIPAEAKAGLDLWQLAQEAHEIGEVEKAVLCGNDWKTTRKKISDVPQGGQFLEKWNQFMSRHGHHCRGEMEVFNVRWSETPDYLLSFVRKYIHGLERANPLKNYRRYAREREELATLCRKRLKNPLKRASFNRLLTHAQRFMPIRENSKSDFARIMTIWRKMLQELGQRLYESDILLDAEDIFFLRPEEIEPVTQNKADFDIRKMIASRRTGYEKDKSVMPPQVVSGKFDPDDFTPDAVDTNVEALNGLAVSSGVVTGIARVILRDDTDEQVLPGRF